MNNRWGYDGRIIGESKTRKRVGCTSRRSLLDCSFFSNPGPSTILILCLVESLLNKQLLDFAKTPAPEIIFVPYFSPTYPCCFRTEFEMVENRDAFLIVILLPWYFFSLSADRIHVTRLTFLFQPIIFLRFFLLKNPIVEVFDRLRFTYNSYGVKISSHFDPRVNLLSFSLLICCSLVRLSGRLSGSRVALEGFQTQEKQSSRNCI
jgi:hypothetical protein